MNGSLLDDFRAELVAARDRLLPRIAGLENFQKLVRPETLGQVTAALDERRRRLGLIDGTLAAIDALDADRYPEMPPEEVEEAILADLRAEKAEIDAAIGEFTEDRRAAALNLAGAVETK